MNDCERFSSDLQAYAEDLLPEAHCAALREHLARCPRCAELAADLKRLRGLLQAAPGVPVSEEFHRRLVAKAIAGAPRTPWGRLAKAAAVVVAAVACGITVAVVLQSRPREDVREVAIRPEGKETRSSQPAPPPEAPVAEIPQGGHLARPARRPAPRTGAGEGKDLPRLGGAGVRKSALQNASARSPQVRKHPSPGPLPRAHRETAKAPAAPVPKSSGLSLVERPTPGKGGAPEASRALGELKAKSRSFRAEAAAAGPRQAKAAELRKVLEPPVSDRAPPVAAQLRRPTPFPSRSILIVEDSPQVREALREQGILVPERGWAFQVSLPRELLVELGRGRRYGRLRRAEEAGPSGSARRAKREARGRGLGRTEPPGEVLARRLLLLAPEAEHAQEEFVPVVLVFLPPPGELPGASVKKKGTQAAGTKPSQGK